MGKICIQTFTVLVCGVCACILVTYINVINKQPAATTSDISSSETSFQTYGYTTDSEVILRKVYYDNRTVEGKSRDVVSIIGDISDYSFGKGIVTHCELNGHKSKRVSIYKDPGINWVNSAYPKIKRFFAIVECYGLPHSAIFNGSIAYVVYKEQKTKALVRVQVEHPLVFNNMDNNPTPLRGNNSIVQCTCLFDHPPRFNEWLIYQKTLGFDRVHLNVDKSFADNATNIYPFLAEGLKSGFVVMEVWSKSIDTIFYHSQSVKIEDCVMRYRGVFNYAVILDYDDFFTPLIPEQKDIHYYIKEMFPDNSIGSAALQWVDLRGALDLGALSQLKDGNVTKTLKSIRSTKRSAGKCAYKISAILMTSVHMARLLLPSFKVNPVNGETILYIAHVRNDHLS